MSFKTQKIPAGTILYHGTNCQDFNEECESLEGPAWLSDAQAVANRFAQWQDGSRPRIVVYRTLSDIELPLILSKSDISNLAEEHYLRLDGAEEIRNSMAESGLPGWIIPNNYPEGADILLSSTSELEYEHTIELDAPQARPKAGY